MQWSMPEKAQLNQRLQRYVYKRFLIGMCIYRFVSFVGVFFCSLLYYFGLVFGVVFVLVAQSTGLVVE